VWLSILKKEFLTSFKIADKEMLQSGPEPSLWRAPTDNDFGNDTPVRSRMWRKAGENRQVVTALVNDSEQGKVCVDFKFDLVNDEGDKIADYSTKYLVTGAGTVEVDNHFKMASENLAEIPRMGMTLIMPVEYDQMTWFGRGATRIISG
jgi:beta-galactosidase